jgi:nicotinate-nucleotide adenylyltransferase
VRTGILGGTFDPIHIAHLHAGECAKHQAQLDRVLFMPAGDPWQKLGRRVSPGRHRLEMTRLAVAGVDGFEADSREVERDGLTFTADTLATFPDDEELFLILGADAASGLPSWERSDEVIARVTVLVAPRPGAPPEAVLEVVPEAVFLDMPLLEVSGTSIRAHAGRGGPYRFLVTEPVHAYAEANALYANPPGGDMVIPPQDTEEPS